MALFQVRMWILCDHMLNRVERMSPSGALATFKKSAEKKVVKKQQHSLTHKTTSYSPIDENTSERCSFPPFFKKKKKH